MYNLLLCKNLLLHILLFNRKEANTQKCMASFLIEKTNKLFLSSDCSFNLFCQLRKDLIQVSYDTVISYIEDRSCLIFVDCNDDIRLFHTSYMLDCSGNTDCKVYVEDVQSYQSVQPADLSASSQHLQLHGSSLLSPPIASARSSRSLKFSALPTPRPPDTRILASMISTVSDTVLNYFQDLYILVIRCESRIELSITSALAPSILVESSA